MPKTQYKIWCILLNNSQIRSPPPPKLAPSLVRFFDFCALVSWELFLPASNVFVFRAWTRHPEKKKKKKWLIVYLHMCWFFGAIPLSFCGFRFRLRRSYSCPTHFRCVYASLPVKHPRPPPPPLTQPQLQTHTCACNRHMHSTIILTTYMRHVMASCDVRCIINSGYYMGWLGHIFATLCILF
jgi:hypothetical protein